MLRRRRRIAREAGAFACAVRGHPRLDTGEKRRWHQGYGRWASDVFIFQVTFAVHHGCFTPIASIDVVGIRPAVSGEVVRLGATPVVARMLSASGHIFEVAACGEDRRRLAGPCGEYGVLAGASATTTPHD
jgi:hypothetical protein